MLTIYTKQQVATMLHVSSSTVDRIVAKGLLEYTRLYPGGPKRFLPAQLEKYEQTLREQAQAHTKR